jgi:hypothetical protein
MRAARRRSIAKGVERGGAPLSRDERYFFLARNPASVIRVR